MLTPPPQAPLANRKIKKWRESLGIDFSTKQSVPTQQHSLSASVWTEFYACGPYHRHLLGPVSIGHPVPYGASRLWDECRVNALEPALLWYGSDTITLCLFIQNNFFKSSQRSGHSRLSIKICQGYSLIVECVLGMFKTIGVICRTHTHPTITLLKAILYLWRAKTHELVCGTCVSFCVWHTCLHVCMPVYIFIEARGCC